MGEFTVGDIILVSFPFSDLKNQKHRPAIVVAKAEYGDVIVCQVTSNPYSAKHCIEIGAKDFQMGTLPVKSYARPDKLFTFSEKLIFSKIGSLTKGKSHEVLKHLQEIFKPN